MIIKLVGALIALLRLSAYLKPHSRVYRAAFYIIEFHRSAGVGF
jgi:hypothetical protein